MFLLLAMLFASPAQAQLTCERWSHVNYSGGGQELRVEVVPAVDGKRVYVCGYVLIGSTQNAVFQLIGGRSGPAGEPCNIGEHPITPPLPIGSTPFVNRIPFASEYTETGEALCWLASGSGDLVAIIYWTQ